MDTPDKFQTKMNERRLTVINSESAHLPPMWPWFKSQLPHHMWVEFVVGSLPGSERFFSGYSGFPLSSKTNFPNSNSTRNQVDKEPLCGCATSNYLFTEDTNFTAVPTVSAVKRVDWSFANFILRVW